MTERLLDIDPLSGIKTFHRYDEATDTTFIRTEEDVEPVLDANRDAEASFSRTSRLPDMLHVASIPPSVQLKWWVEKGVNIFNPDHKQAMGRLLDDPEWRYLKRVPLTLGRLR